MSVSAVVWPKNRCNDRRLLILLFPNVSKWTSAINEHNVCIEVTLSDGLKITSNSVYNFG